MRQIHAFNPIPGAFTFAGSSRIKIFSVQKHKGFTRRRLAVEGKSKILISTNTGNLEVLECQLPGGNRLVSEQISSHQSAPWLEPTKLTEQPA